MRANIPQIRGTQRSPSKSVHRIVKSAANLRSITIQLTITTVEYLRSDYPQKLVHLCLKQNYKSMTAATVFSYANLLVLPMWLLLIVLPKWKVTRFLTDYKLIPIVLSVIYVIYISMTFQTEGGLDFGSLESVMALFTKENAVLAGWVHYLAFDLLIGMWMVQKNREFGMHQLLMVPCLFFTFMACPLGFLLLTLLSSIKSKQITTL